MKHAAAERGLPASKPGCTSKHHKAVPRPEPLGPLGASVHQWAKQGAGPEQAHSQVTRASRSSAHRDSASKSSAQKCDSTSHASHTAAVDTASVSSDSAFERPSPAPAHSGDAPQQQQQQQHAGARTAAARGAAFGRAIAKHAAAASAVMTPRGSPPRKPIKAASFAGGETASAAAMAVAAAGAAGSASARRREGGVSATLEELAADLAQQPRSSHDGAGENALWASSCGAVCFTDRDCTQTAHAPQCLNITSPGSPMLVDHVKSLPMLPQSQPTQATAACVAGATKPPMGRASSASPAKARPAPLSLAEPARPACGPAGLLPDWDAVGSGDLRRLRRERQVPPLHHYVLPVRLLMRLMGASCSGTCTFRQDCRAAGCSF